MSERMSSISTVFITRGVSPNENKMSDGGRGRALLGVEVWKSSQKWSVPRSIAWLGSGIAIGEHGSIYLFVRHAFVSR